MKLCFRCGINPVDSKQETEVQDLTCFMDELVKIAQSCPAVSNPMDYTVHGIFSGQNAGMGSLSLLQGVIPTQGSNPGLPHCRRILSQLSYQERPWMS